MPVANPRSADVRRWNSDPRRASSDQDMGVGSDAAKGGAQLFSLERLLFIPFA